MELDNVDEKLEDRVLNSEYRIWKKNAPFLYDLVMTHSLEWPTLTVEWIDADKKKQKGRQEPPQKIVLGTHTAPGEQNYLMIAEVGIYDFESSHSFEL
jgi:histone-binding protein RBBP4